MDYEKAYKEALERARQLYDSATTAEIDEKKVLESIFPELCESEDERIRKEIIKLIQFYYGSSLACKHTVSKDDMIACLEKQDEQKSSWSEDDEEMIDFMIEFIESLCWRKDLTKRKDEVLSWFKSLKPKNRWKPSEQNIKDLEWCADLVKDKIGVGFHRLQVFIDELKNNI